MKPHYKYSWQEQYLDALSHTSAATLHTKIAAARKALDERVAELLVCKGSSAERQAVIDALFSLRFLELQMRRTQQSGL